MTGPAMLDEELRVLDRWADHAEEEDAPRDADVLRCLATRLAVAGTRGILADAEPDAGAAGETQTERMQGSSDARFRALHDAVKPAPALDQELGTLLMDIWQDGLELGQRWHSITTAQRVALSEMPTRMVAAIEQYVARRTAEAEGVTVATGELVGDTVIWNDPYPSIEIQCHESGGARYLKHGDRVRLVRAAQKGEVGK